MLAKVVTHPIFRKIMPKVIPPVHRAMAKLSGGKFVPGAGLVLNTIGAKSGQPRTTPLETIPRRDGSYLIVGSNFAQESHPAWTYNLIANPDDVSILIRGETVPVEVTLLEGEARDEGWEEALAHWPAWEEYRGITDRTFRIFHLVPVN